MSLKASFVSYLNQKYPTLDTQLLNNLVSDQLLSPAQITLSQLQLAQIKTEINQYWKLRQWGVEKRSDQFKMRQPNNYSVCMSYDFHINSAGQPELIEINTNASFLALGLELYSFLKLPNPVNNFDESSLVQMFLEEIDLCQKTEKSIAIVDENPADQRLYVEFLLFKSLFEKHNIRSEVFDISQLEEFKNYSLIYNRYTDFYLQTEKSKALLELYEKNNLNLSPHPYEYFLLADKNRLIDWNLQNDVEKPASLLKTYDLGLADKEQVWSERKNLFFKPKSSFGGKQVYKGASMSHKMFDSVCNDGFLAQQLSTPAEIEFLYNSENLKLKYDLRCFVYKNELQLIVARLYQGQTTNLKTPGGGFACVVIN